MTAQLQYYLGKQARPDLQTAVSFLSTRVQCPEVDNFKKLGSCVRYLRRTTHYPLTLEADSLSRIRWWIDSSYAVHRDMKSHTGTTLSLGKGSIYSMSTKQRLNTRSSTEAELVGANDAMGMVLWTRHFLEAQGYNITDDIVYQDSESTILLGKNGRRSSSKRTRHLEIRYFFITDNVARGKLTIEHCPTHEMLANYFTKPLQGLASFLQMVKLILNLSDELLNLLPHECVEDTRAMGLKDQSRVSIADSHQ